MSNNPLTPIVRIAMWSGPRNISTAMMRAFENRADCIVWDEPFFAAYLQETGTSFPQRDEIIAAHETDVGKIIARLTGPLNDPNKPGATVFYQKHMTHHMVPQFSRDWLKDVVNIFLIREPERVLASYAQKRANATLEDIGFPQQLEIFNQIADTLGAAPLVIDTKDVLKDPRGTLSAICDACAIPFDEDMLSWPVGRRNSDGIWASHWYHVVEASTGFAPPDTRPMPVLDGPLGQIAARARPIYQQLAKHRLWKRSSV